MTAIRNLSTLLPAVPIVAAIGCGRPFNDQIDLVGTDAPLPALSAAPAETQLRGGVSLHHGLNRQDWSTVKVQVPRDQVGHYPTYTLNFRWQKERSPWDPAFPTASDAVTDTPDGGQDVADAVAEPFVAAGMLVWAPIDMIFINQLWVEKRSPSEPFLLVPDRAARYPAGWFDAPNKPRAWRRTGVPEASSGESPDDPAGGGPPHP